MCPKINIKMMMMLIVLVFYSSVIFARTNFQDDKKLSETVSIFTQKVLLSSEKEAQLLNIVTNLKKDISLKPERKDALLKDAQIRVENLLDKKQKMKYDILKNDFWKQVLE